MTALTEAQAVTVARGIAADNDLTLDADALAAVIARLTADLALDDNWSLAFGIATPFSIERGQVIDVQPIDHALGIVRQHGKPVAKPVQDAPSPTTTPAKIEVNTPIAAFGRQLAAQHDAAVLREASEGPNPFLAGPNFNRTKQQVLLNKDPARAAQLKAQAGK